MKLKKSEMSGTVTEEKMKEFVSEKMKEQSAEPMEQCKTELMKQCKPMDKKMVKPSRELGMKIIRRMQQDIISEEFCLIDHYGAYTDELIEKLDRCHERFDVWTESLK